MGVTIKQIAQEVGLSWPAVSQILNQRGRFAEDTRKRVMAAAAKHGYRPNASARALRQQSSKMVGVLFRNDAGNPLTNMSAFEYLLGINQRFQDADYGTLLIRAGELAQEGDIEPRVFRERLVDGVIVVGSLPELLIERVNRLAQRVIWVDSPVWNKTCCVRRDEHAAGETCARVLADLGYKSVTFVARSKNRLLHHSQASREAGARAGAKANKVRIRVINWPEDEPQQEYAALQELIAGGDGIVAGTLPVARRIAHHAATIHRTPGYDFGMVCCDDSFDTQTAWPSLSRVSFHRYELGVQAGDMMLQLLAAPDKAPRSYLKADSWSAGCSAWGPDATPTRKNSAVKA